jgi:hypothetical protein
VVVCGQVVGSTNAGREADIKTTFLSIDGKVIWANRYGTGNGTDDIPLRIAGKAGFDTWLLALGHVPGTPRSSPRELMVVKYGLGGNFEWARNLGIQSDQIERIWSTSGVGYRR